MKNLNKVLNLRKESVIWGLFPSTDMLPWTCVVIADHLTVNAILQKVKAGKILQNLSKQIQGIVAPAPAIFPYHLNFELKNRGRSVRTCSETVKERKFAT
jgi:uncharacterized protein with gpF-like domain